MAAHIPASELRERLGDILNRVAYRGERIIIDRHEKPSAVLVPIEDLEVLLAFEDHIDGEDAKRVRASGEKAIPLSEAKKILEM